MMITRPIRFTRFGTFYILFTLGVGAAAINTGNNLLYLILGILLGFIIISGFLSDSGLWGIRTQWVPTGSFYVGEKADFRCLVSKGWFPAVAVTVKSRWKELDALHTYAAWIPSRGHVALAVVVAPSRRGFLTLESCQYSTQFPFGLFQKSHSETIDDKWIVYPRVYRLPANFFISQGVLSTQSTSNRIGTGAVPLMLRDRRDGDALRQVHWRISAKRQRLIVKEMEEESGHSDHYVVKAWPTDLSPEATERFISFLASLLFSAHEHDRPFGLSTPDTYFEPAHSREHLHQIFRYLALVDPSVQTEAKRLEHRQESKIDVLTLWKIYAERR